MNKYLRYFLLSIVSLSTFYIFLCILGVKRVEVTRTKELNAYATNVYKLVADLKEWGKWSSWHKEDPDMKIIYGDINFGKGGKYYWDSPKMGKGNLEITYAMPYKTIETKMKFSDWDGFSLAKMTFEETSPGKTKMTWSMTSDTDVPFFFRGMMILMNFDKMLGNDFEKGMAGLEEIASKMPKSYRGFEINEQNWSEKHFFTMRKKVNFDKISEYYGINLPILIQKANDKKVDMGGFPSGLFFNWDTTLKQTDMAVAIPLKEKTVFSNYSLKAGKVLALDYFGNYDDTSEAHAAMEDYMFEKKLKLRNPVIEEYVTDAAIVKDTSNWLTRIYYPVE